VTLMVLGVGSPAAFCTLACVTTVAAGCRLWQVPVRHFWIAASVAAYLPYAIAIPWLIEDYRDYRQLEEDYPVQSLTARLVYERPYADTNPPPLAADRTNQDGRIQTEIDNAAAAGHWSTRSRSLHSLLYVHEEHVADFVNADGFGVKRTRVLPARREYIELQEPEPILVAAPDEGGPIADASGLDAEERTAIAPTLDGAMTGFHMSGAVDFINADGFGVVASGADERGRWRGDLERVIGFQAHGFRHRPESMQRNRIAWHLEQLQLVSLLKHDEPAVYLSENLPRMDELREAETRPLNEFEHSALEQLRTGEELIVRESTDTLEMLGSLRAGKACTVCHHVPAMTLLGAFSYQLRRQGTRPRRDAL
ncbi:MAG TPA: hypothetical protein VHB77_03535, partial [Planctomycetaceae bacterium]|nr:hypothetical protein [Planctomycetaceae bacterium]